MKTFTTYAEKKAKQFFNLLQGYTKGIRTTAILILLLMGVSHAWGASEGSSWYDWASSENVYFDNTNSSYSNVSMLIGRQWNYGGDGVGSSGVNFTKVANTNNLYHAATTWSHYNTLLFMDAKDWGWEGNKVTQRYTYADNYTNTNNVDINGTELFYAASSTKGATLNHQDLTSYTALNYTQTVQQHLSTDGGSNYSASTTALATVKVSSYKLNSKNTTTSSSGTIASGSSSTTCSAARTATVTYTVSGVKTGYTFVGWYDGTTQKSTATTYNALKATGAKTITARFKENTYSVTISAGAGGAVSPSGSKTIGQVTKTTVTATPNANYEFVNWTATGGVVVANTTSASTTITATATGTLTANFRSTATHSLTVVAGNGISQVAGSTDPVTLGSTYAITATPKTGYSFSTWTANPAANATFGSATTANTTVTVKNGSVTVTASATENMSTLTTSNKYDAGDPGYAAPYANASQIGIATTATVTATAAGNGYTFTGWTLTNCTRTDGGTADATSITVRSNGDSKAATVVANYAEDLTSEWHLVGNGNIFPDGWNVNNNSMMKKISGKSTESIVALKVNVTTVQTYEFKIVDDNGSASDTWYGYSTGNTFLTWTATGTKNVYSGDNNANNLKFTPNVAGEYEFKVDYSGAYPAVTITYPTAYKVTYTSTYTGGTVSATAENNTLHLPNTEITFTATPKTGYTFKGWQDGNGTQLSIANPYTHKMTKDITINAVFEENTYNIVIVADPAEAAETLTSSPQTVGVEPVAISTTAKFTYKFDNWEAPDGITITDANNPSTSITATKAGTVTAHFTKMQPTTVYLKPNEQWKQADARFAIHYWHDGQPAGWVDMTDVGCNRDYFVGSVPAGYTQFKFVRMNPETNDNNWDNDWNETGTLNIPTDGKNLFTLPTTGDQVWNGATGTWGTYTPPTYTININAPEAGSIAVTVGGNTTTVTDTPEQITNIAAGTTFTIAYTPNAGFELGHSEVEGIKETYDGAGTYTVCGPVDITAHFVTEEEQVVYLRPNGTWLSDKAIFYAYVFNRYGDDEWIELTTEETDYTGAYGCTIPAGYNNVIFVRLNPNGTDNSNNKLNFHNAWNQSVDYVIPVNTTTNRFIIGEKVISGGDEGKYQGSWEASDTPIYGIPGDWQGTDTWAADEYPLMGPDGLVTVNITQTNDTLGFKVYRYPYGTDEDSRKWLGNNGTMVRGGEAVHEGGWTMSENTNNCGLAVDVAGDYVFHFNIRESKLTVQYPPMPVPSTITLSAQRIFEDAQLDWIAGNGTEANPYQLYVDETARITITGLDDVPGLTTCYRVGDNEEQTSNIIDFTNILTEDTAYTVYAYYKNATGATSDTVTVQTPYIKGLPMPFYLMTSPSQEINIDRIAAGENILVQFRSDSKAPVNLYLNDTEGTPLTTIDNTDSYDFEYDVPDDIEPCILTFIAKAQGAGLHGRIFEVKADVAIYKNVIIKVNDPEGWVKNVYMWRDYSDAVLTQWPGDPVLQNFGTWRVFSVKYPYYDRFIVNDGNAGNSTQTIDWELPSDDTCYELLDPADNGSDKEEDKGKYGLKVADCPKNLLVEDIKDTTIMEGEQIVVMPKIFVGLGYQMADIKASVHYDNNGSIKAMMSGTNVTILGNAEGESKVTVTYILDNVRIEETFKVTVTKRTKITIQVKVPTEHGPEADRIGWWENDKIYVRYWNAQNGGTDQKMNYLTQTDYHYYFEATIPLDDTGKTNFNIFYDNRNEDWRYSTNATGVTEDGCYLVYNDGSGDRGLRHEGVRCLTDQYQVRIAMGSGKTYTSNIVNAPEDTLSFFAPGMNETGYKAGVIMLYQNDKMIATIEPSTFAVSNVYTATLNDALNGLDNVSTYSGNFYIRTWGTDGDINNMGWHSVKEWNASQKKSRSFTEFTSREGEFYNHYWVQAMNTGNYDGKDVSACVANEYNDDLAGKLLEDKHTDEKGDIKVGTDKVINVRFGYDPRTNYFGRAILQGSESDTYLNLHCDNAYRDKDCTEPFPHGDGQSCLDNKMHDMSNWVYQRDFYVPITNSKPSASLYIEAKSPNKTKTVIDHLLGYVTNEITGEATTTPIQKTIIGSGTTNGTYLMRVIYDFKTNRLIAAWLPQGTIEVNTEKTLNADVLFVREENSDVPQIQLSNQGKIKSLESMFFAMELQRGGENPNDPNDPAHPNHRHEEQYWFTLPFDCVVGSISGVPGYMNIWGIQRYRGDLRAQKGWFIDTPTFWEWLTPQDTLKAGEGYLLAFDKKNAPFEEIEVDKMDAEGNIIDEEKETISIMRLYFPSIKSGFDMQQQSAEQLTVTYPDHTCTITYKDRCKQDSNWKVIGTTSYSNAGVTSYTQDTDPGYEEWEEGAPKFRYEYSYTFDENNVRTSYTYTPELGAGEGVTYKSFFSYMVQFAGTITWQPIMSETVPEGIAARRYVPESERTSFTTRLEIANAEGEKQDQAFVALDEKATSTFDQNKDLNKIINAGTNIYTLSEGIPFAGNTLPMEKTTVPVGVRIATAGEYTFRMPDGTDGISVTLVDNVIGTHTDMLMDEYTITLDAGTIENRFYLVVDPDRTATSVENIGEEAKGEEAKDQIKKFLIDGQLFIRTADGIFDAKGQRL